MKEQVDVLSDVKYSNVFIDGRRTHLRNRDCFLYISLDQIDKLQILLHCRGFPAHVIKPMKFQSYHRCGQIGHKAASGDCPALVPEEVCHMIQPFRGGQNQLSNLHMCPEGCA